MMPRKKSASQCLPREFLEAHLNFPGAGQFLQRIQSRMLKALEDECCEVVARLEINEAGSVPSYRLEGPRGKVLLVVNGVSHRRLTDAAVSNTKWTWSSTTMSFDQIYETAMCVLSDEIRTAVATRPKTGSSNSSRRPIKD